MLVGICRKRGTEHVAEKLEGTVILRSRRAVLGIAKEESRIAMKILRARSFAQFPLSGRARFFFTLRMTAKGSG
jgi:hypothetical protein